MNGDTAELLKAITDSIEKEVKPLREDIRAVRTAVQDRGERLAHVEEKVKVIGDCGGNTAKVIETARGVVSNRYFIFVLFIALLGAVIRLRWGS